MISDHFRHLIESHSHHWPFYYMTHFSFFGVEHDVHIKALQWQQGTESIIRLNINRLKYSKLQSYDISAQNTGH